MIKFIFGMQRNSKMFYKLILFGFAQPGMPKVPEIENLHIFSTSLEKHGG